MLCPNYERGHKQRIVVSGKRGAGDEMKKRRRKRRRRLHITPRGYIVISIFVLLIVFIVLLSVALAAYGKEVRQERKAAETPAPSADAGAAASPDSVVSDTIIAPAAATPTPTATPALASPGSRLPTEEELAGAVDGVIRTSDVALRKGPGKEYEKIYKYSVGEYVQVYAEENGYTFIQVLSDQRYGFLSSDFVTKFGPLGSDAAATPVPAAPEGAVLGLVNVDELKLRSKPSTKGNEPLQMCKNGELLWVFFQTNDFYYVQCAASGTKGYVFAEYVMVSAPAPTGTPVP